MIDGLLERILTYEILNTKYRARKCIAILDTDYEEERVGTVVKVLCYKSEGLWFDFRLCHWNFPLT
jgi:hypothetical protein